MNGEWSHPTGDSTLENEVLESRRVIAAQRMTIVNLQHELASAMQVTWEDMGRYSELHVGNSTIGSNKDGWRAYHAPAADDGGADCALQRLSLLTHLGLA